MQRKAVIAILALVLVLGAFGSLILTACGSDTGSTGAREESSAPAAAATGEPLKIGFNEGFTGFMAVDAQLTDHGIKTRARRGRQPVDGPADRVLQGRQRAPTRCRPSTRPGSWSRTTASR